MITEFNEKCPYYEITFTCNPVSVAKNGAIFQIHTKIIEISHEGSCKTIMKQPNSLKNYLYPKLFMNSLDKDELHSSSNAWVSYTTYYLANSYKRGPPTIALTKH